MNEVEEKEKSVSEENSESSLPGGMMEENQLISEKLDGLEKMIASLRDVMREAADHGEATARQVNWVNENLHKENQKLKEGLYDSMILPVLQDVIGIGSDIAREIKRCQKNGESAAVESLENVLEDLHDTLEKYRVQVYRPQEGEAFEPVTQKVVEAIETGEEQKHRTVAKVCSVGYRFIKGDTLIVLKPSKVNVYVLKKDLPQTGGKQDE